MPRVKVVSKGVGDFYSYKRFGLDFCDINKEVVLTEYSLEEIKGIESAKRIANGVCLLYNKNENSCLVR